MRPAIAVIGILLFFKVAYSATIYVPDNYPTIQGAISAAAANDTIIVRDGTWKGAGNKNLDFSGKAATLTSENGPANCIIDCEGNGRGFVFQSTETSSTVVDGFSIINGGNVVEGGGIYSSSAPVIMNCIISNNSAIEKGGGIYFWYESPTIVSCVISGNTAGSGSTYGYGGGICVYFTGYLSLVSISDCEITGNTAFHDGGGIHASYNHLLSVDNCVISGNTAGTVAIGGDGGGIFLESGTKTMISNCFITDNLIAKTGYGGGIYETSSQETDITDCTIENNTSSSGGGIYFIDISVGYRITGCDITGNSAVLHGGGVDCYNSPSWFSRCFIKGNVATNGDGGGIRCYWYSTPTLTCCVFDGNSANMSGGGLYSSGSIKLSMENNIIYNNNADSGGGVCSAADTDIAFSGCTFNGNTAGTNGGAVFTSATNSVIQNCILWDDSATNGMEIAVGGIGVHDIRYSDVAGGLVGVWDIGGGSTIIWGAENIDSDPLFLDTLNDDYHLTFASPCIDAGDNNAPSLPTDFEGDPRIFPGNGKGVYLVGSPPQPAVVDMGADEYCLLKRQGLK